MKEIIETKEVTVTVAIPKQIFIPWEEFVSYDNRGVDSVMSAYMSAILDGSSLLYYDRHDAFEFVEPPSTHGEAMKLEEIYEVIETRLGSDHLSDKELLNRAVIQFAENETEVLEHMQMLETFGYPKTKQELTQKIYEYFYSDNDYSYLSRKDWFYEPYLQILADVENGSIVGCPGIYEVIDECVKDRLQSSPNCCDVSIAYMDEYLTWTFAMDGKGITVKIEWGYPF